MIIQGTNLPIQIEFDEDASTFTAISAMLYPRGDTSSVIKQWELEDMIVDGVDVYLPIEQADLLPPNLNITEDLNVTLEVKWLTEGDVEHGELYHTYIEYRKDNTILE